MATKVFDDRMSLSGTFSRLRTRDSWIDGEVVTKQGIVTVYYEKGFDGCGYARFDFVADGALHMRNISGRTFTKRGLSIMAAKFAREQSHD